MEEDEAVLEKFAFSNALSLSGEKLNFSYESLTFVLFGGSVLFRLPAESKPFAFFSSEAGDMGGVIRQLCRVDSINSRGAVDT